MRLRDWVYDELTKPQNLCWSQPIHLFEDICISSFTTEIPKQHRIQTGITRVNYLICCLDDMMIKVFEYTQLLSLIGAEEPPPNHHLNIHKLFQLAFEGNILSVELWHIHFSLSIIQRFRILDESLSFDGMHL